MNFVKFILSFLFAIYHILKPMSETFQFSKYCLITLCSNFYYETLIMAVYIIFNMSASFKPIYHECNNVGKRVKSSKKRYQWKFSLENREHTLDLYVSKLSGKRKVMLNGEIKFNGKKQGGILFSYAFKIGRTTVMVF